MNLQKPVVCVIILKLKEPNISKYIICKNVCKKKNTSYLLKEQYKVAQEKLRRAHSLIARIGEIYMLQAQALEAELHECTEQFDPCHTTLQQQARRELNNVFAESRTENKLYNMAAEFKSNIVNQADTLGSASIPKEPAILDERSLLACIVRAVYACPNSRISTCSALQLLGMLVPLDWDVYENRYGKLHDFVASHPEFFVIDGDFIHVRDSEGAQQFVSDVTAAASSSAPCSSLLSSVAVAPVLQITPHKIAPALGSRSSNSMPSDEVQPGQSSRCKLVANGEDMNVHLFTTASGGKQKRRSVDAKYASII